MYTIEYVNDGYIKGDEAKDMNTDDILTSYKEGTEQSNRERAAKGFTELEVTGWGKKPAYDAAKQPTANRIIPKHNTHHAPNLCANTPVTGCETPHINWVIAKAKLICLISNVLL